MKRKLLLYNWDPIDGPAGGGVTSYLKELIPFLMDKYDVNFLNSGRKYTDDDKLRIKKRDNLFGKQIKTYEVVNSPILAPGNQSIINIKKYLEDESLYNLITNFINDCGGFDIIHYHNLEGLSLKILRLKEEFPDTKFFFSFHNYYPICTQVNLWKDNNSSCNTTDYTECAACYERSNYELTKFRFKYIDIPGLKEIFSDYSKTHPDIGDAGLYADFRKQNISCLNSHFDRLIAVSKRTGEILSSAGMDVEKLKVLYAGTKAANWQVGKCTASSYGDKITLLYMGYLRKDKGFYFFSEALEKIPDEIANKINVKIVGRHNGNNAGEVKELQHINSQEYRFSSIKIYDGYKDYSELKDITADVNLGIIPVLWEDNLPRVAIEQVAMGIPILCSDMGGAGELGGGNKNFIFKNGDTDDFIEKIRNIMEHRNLLEEYWKNAMTLKTMEEHSTELIKLYEK